MKKREFKPKKTSRTNLKSKGPHRPTKKVQKRPKRQTSTPVMRLGIFNLEAPAGANRKKKILGRGPSSGHGQTSTRGTKGQTARAGRDFYPGFEGGHTPLIRRIPKRGFTSRFKKEYQIVNLGDLNKIKETHITLDLLEAKRMIKDKREPVKVLGDGQIESPVTVQAHAFSKAAAEAIKNAGGKVEIINA